MLWQAPKNTNIKNFLCPLASLLSTAHCILQLCISQSSLMGRNACSAIKHSILLAPITQLLKREHSFLILRRVTTAHHFVLANLDFVTVSNTSFKVQSCLKTHRHRHTHTHIKELQFLELSKMVFLCHNPQFGSSKIFHFFLKSTE